MDGFIEILKIILPAVAVFFAAFLIVKRFLENEDKPYYNAIEFLWIVPLVRVQYLLNVH